MLRRAAFQAIVAGVLCQIASAQNAIRYVVKLADPERHFIQVTINIPPGLPAHELQMPVWNALYQVRDFSQYINWIRGQDTMGHALPLVQLNASRWRVTGATNGAKIEYELFSNDSGSFGAELNTQHAFLNLAEVLIYVEDARRGPQQVEFTNLPPGWKIATPLTATQGGYLAKSYDQLVDSPIEIGTFRESDFTGKCGTYRVVLDSPNPIETMNKILSPIQQIVAGATRWMNDCPFNTYTFIYHFSDSPGRGGMEHASGTAITLPMRTVTDHLDVFTSISAHEFFHLWNVKRIRPQSLEPIDYTQAEYTPTLWFSEGVDSTAADYIELRSGLLSEKKFLNDLGSDITELENRPAHLTQSAEESSIDAWLEKYPYYGLPERSISYYNKGELLGILLDLRMRRASGGRASLQLLFRWMNQQYAKEGRFFADSAAIRDAAEKLSGADLHEFFAEYISGTREIPWDEFFGYVGLRVNRSEVTLGDLGFEVVQKFDRPPVVAAIDAGSEAEHAGMKAGDAIVQVNDKPVERDFDQQIRAIAPGELLRLRVSHEGAERELKWPLAGHKQTVFELEDVSDITAEQKHHRAMWLFDGAPSAP
jgi:predicted metalloprotease with PDZ domain